MGERRTLRRDAKLVRQVESPRRLGQLLRDRLALVRVKSLAGVVLVLRRSSGSAREKPRTGTLGRTHRVAVLVDIAPLEDRRSARVVQASDALMQEVRVSAMQAREDAERDALMKPTVSKYRPDAKLMLYSSSWTQSRIYCQNMCQYVPPETGSTRRQRTW